MGRALNDNEKAMALFDEIGSKQREEQTRYRRRLLLLILVVLALMGLIYWDISSPKAPCPEHVDCGAVN